MQFISFILEGIEVNTGQAFGEEDILLEFAETFEDLFAQLVKGIVVVDLADVGFADLVQRADNRIGTTSIFNETIYNESPGLAEIA
jgi:hypothetical protein